jgi:hypothetical protein
MPRAGIIASSGNTSNLAWLREESTVTRARIKVWYGIFVKNFRKEKLPIKRRKNKAQQKKSSKLS